MDDYHKNYIHISLVFKLINQLNKKWHLKKIKLRKNILKNTKTSKEAEKNNVYFLY